MPIEIYWSVYTSVCQISFSYGMFSQISQWVLKAYSGFESDWNESKVKIVKILCVNPCLDYFIFVPLAQ